MSDLELHNARKNDTELVEPGDAFARLEQRWLAATLTWHYDVIVIGGGPGGSRYRLPPAVAPGLRFLILDAGERIGDPWRERLGLAAALHTLALRRSVRHDLSGLSVFLHFPAPRTKWRATFLFPRIRLPVRPAVRASNGCPSKTACSVLQGAGFTPRARQVVVAMSSYQRPRVPEFARALKPGIVQLHSFDYRNLGTAW